MSPVVLGSVGQPRTIVITPSLFSGDENKSIVGNAELPKYAVGLFESNGSGPRKRKRLTHLTPEEKIMRRKLKNRVAAQTARDRKKARMETLEDAVSKIHEQMNKLLDVNSQLLKKTQNLEEENMVLRRRLGLDPSPSVLEETNREVSIIKNEVDVLSLMDSSKGAFKLESSDDESCVMKSYEEDYADNNVGFDVSTQQVPVCRSPVPAAGSCQTSEADPLGNRKQGNLIQLCQSGGNSILPAEEDTDITTLLRALQAINPQQCAAPKVTEKGNATGSSDSVAQIPVAFDVLGDHGYTKPAIELSYATQSNGRSSETLNPSDSTKLAALFEETKQCTPHDLFPIDFMDTLPYCDGNDTNSAEISCPDIEAVLDSLINGNSCDDNVRTEIRASSPDVNSVASDDSGVSLCDSPISLNTPSPLSEPEASTSPFFSPSADCSDFFEGDQLDLFPQLSVM